jgi:2-polyprenyl-3-methyl-5-hydroxy-6-metoxy-1,4-benzoquinol methylase/glycosyltransferase involved in cell wall biosynthesis
MYIAMWCGGLPFDGDTIRQGKSLGGSETAAYYMAKELVNVGHNVTLFTNSQNVGKYDNVNYECLGRVTQNTPLGDRWHQVLQTPLFDIAIIQRHPNAFHYHYNTKLNIWWLHDLALHRNNPGIQAHLVNIDKIFTVSEFHRQQVSKVYDIDPKHIYPTKNGIDYAFIDALPDTSNRIARSLFFAARPERGLENLVGPLGLMNELPNCHLYVAGYDNTTEQMRGYYEYLWNRCKSMPNVTLLGPLGKTDLYKYMKSMMLYVYPTDFKDTSCILALEAQACGLPVLCSKTGAIPETLEGGGSQVIPLISGKINAKKWLKTINLFLSNDNAWRHLHKKCQNIHQSWYEIATDWSKQFELMMSVQSLNNKNPRLYSHLEHNSDIMALIKAGATEESWPSLRKNYHFFLDNTYKEHYKKYYEYEKNRGVNYGPESLVGQPRFEATCDFIKTYKPARVLDYGCAHGHYVVNLAKRFADIAITGIDLEQTNIDKAKKWAEDEKLQERCQFVCADISNENIELSDKYDLIMCQEILEHVPNPQEVILKLSKYLNDNGKFLISVPYGPWEFLGYDLHPGWRAHIHMFERSDLFEMFGKQKDYKLIAISHHSHFGNYMCSFGISDIPLGEINYERKIIEQKPAQTLSVCMIARNAAYTLGNTLKTVKGIADEIIVGIDKNTTDNTKEIAEAFGAKTFEIDCPIDIGFDIARNLTLDKATMDWIMWIDSDETFYCTSNFKNYLRENCYNAYAIPQHHYAVQPAALFKTDLPARVFRNHVGMKFFGFVHEHPELALNKGPGKSILLQDCGIMHIGYPTEEIRRKRFERNFPLMIKDRQKYPDRVLGIFLWCRDLAHYIKFMLEKTGGRTTDDLILKANEIIQTWRKLVDTGNTRMILEAIPYMSEAVKLLGNGINYKLDLQSSSLGREIPKSTMMVGTFADTNDIEKLTNMLLKANIDIYKEVYY